MTQHHFRQCTLCEAMCGIDIETEGTEILSIRGDREDPFSRGYVCPKAVALKDVHEDPDRLRRPLKRDGSSWREIGWDEALDEAADRLKAVQKAHGRHSVATYLGNPTVHSMGAMLFAPLFVKSLRTRSRFSATSVDQLPHMLASYLMFGHQLLVPVPDIDRTSYFLVFGANPAASNGSMMTAPGAMRRIESLRRKGGKVVVLDPRLTGTAARADEHHFIRPGTDALVLLAILHTLFSENRVRLGRCQAFTNGVDAMWSVVRRFSPERVAPVTGIAAATIRKLAFEFVSARTAVCYGRMGISTQEFGGLATWLVNVLNIVTGNLDSPGGAMFTRPAVDIVGSGGALLGRGHFGRFKSRVRGLPEFGGELPAAVLAEEIETPGEGQIRALVTFGGNPVLSTPNGHRLDAALSRLDFFLSIDIYLNETSRRAHMILPSTFALERDHYDLAFHVLAVRNTAKYSPTLFPRGPEARHDWEILNELTRRLDGEGQLKSLVAWGRSALLAQLGPRGLLDLGLRFGPHGDRFLPFKKGLNLKALEAAVHGIDLGPLEPCLPDRLFTRDQKIELAPKPYLADLSRLEKSLEERGKRSGDSLELIGRRDLRSNNSWLHNSKRLVKGPARCTLVMNPSDAQRRGLSNGERVNVRSRVGRVTALLEISEEIMPGVVSLPHGWGHAMEGVQLSVASKHPGVSLNDLTDDGCVDLLTGNAAFTGVPVTVDRGGKA